MEGTAPQTKLDGAATNQNSDDAATNQNQTTNRSRTPKNRRRPDQTTPTAQTARALLPPPLRAVALKPTQPSVTDDRTKATEYLPHRR